MASKTPANHGKHTPSELVRERIIAHLKIGPCKRASAIGYAAYPDYTFRNRQGPRSRFKGICSNWSKTAS